MSTVLTEGKFSFHKINAELTTAAEITISAPSPSNSSINSPLKSPQNVSMDSGSNNVSSLRQQLLNQQSRDQLLIDHITQKNLLNLDDLKQESYNSCWAPVLKEEKLPQYSSIHPLEQLLAHYRYLIAKPELKKQPSILAERLHNILIEAAAQGNFRALRRLEIHYVCFFKTLLDTEYAKVKPIADFFDTLAELHGTPGNILAAVIHLYIADNYNTRYKNLKTKGDHCTFEADGYVTCRDKHYIAAYKQLRMSVKNEQASKDKIEAYYSNTQYSNLENPGFLAAAFKEGRATIYKFKSKEGNPIAINSFIELCNLYKVVFLDRFVKSRSSSLQLQIAYITEISAIERLTATEENIIETNTDNNNSTTPATPSRFSLKYLSQ